MFKFFARENEQKLNAQFLFYGGKMKVYQILERVKKELESVNICDSAEAEWLVALAIGANRTASHSTRELSCEEEARILEFLKQRKTHKPLAYIAKNADFYGYLFNVNENVLVPRPETEELVSLVLKNIKNGESVLDIGTGSGAIAIVLAKESNAKVTAVDISEKALSVAKENAKKLGANIEFVLSDLFENLENRVFDKIVSNPPYISENEFQTLDIDVKNFEPKLALVAENNGLEIYERIINQATKHLTKNGEIYFEIGYLQAEQVKKLLEKDFENIKIYKDLEGKDRMVSASRKGENNV